MREEITPYPENTLDKETSDDWMVDPPGVVRRADDFMKEARKSGVTIVKAHGAHHIHLYHEPEGGTWSMAFRCYRDVQNYCAQVGFTIKNTVDLDGTPAETPEPEKKTKTRTVKKVVQK